MLAKQSWDQRVQRAQELAQLAQHSSEILSFYAEVLVWQRDVFGRISGDLTGSFEHDHPVVLGQFGSLVHLVQRCGSEVLAAEAAEICSATGRWKELLFNYWNGELPAGQSFFARACLQPYLEALSDFGKPPFDSSLAHSRPNEGNGDKESLSRLCPFCRRRPQVALLSDEAAAGGGLEGGVEGGRRFLMCGDCLTIWPFARVTCAFCEESDPGKLPYYSTTQVPNVRVECCDSCMHYIKSIDLTKDRRPVPLVDELSTITLDLWAQERGYTKVLPNLAGI